jgi:hypothetical protein
VGISDIFLKRFAYYLISGLKQQISAADSMASSLTFQHKPFPESSDVRASVRTWPNSEAQDELLSVSFEEIIHKA